MARSATEDTSALACAGWSAQAALSARSADAEEGWQTRVSRSVARFLIDGPCTTRRVAAALGLHPRTLQRRLREEGASFEAIKDGVRRELALSYLQRPDMTLTRVTEILGYSESSVLSRSCQRWFSASPRKLRDRIQAAQWVYSARPL
jgi:AraC-like DNA-binding protein